MALTQVKTTGLADDAVTEAKVANDAISPAEMKAGTDGHIITYDASGNPTTVGPGTDGQVLTSTGAGSPPAFETLPTSGAALTGSTDNTVVTVTGANAMAGEANLTFDGNHLSQTIDAHAEGIRITAAGSHYPEIRLGANRSGAGDTVGYILGQWNGKSVTAINMLTGTDTTNKDDGVITFNTSSADNISERFRIESDGDVKVVDGDLVIGTSGHGIDFAAAPDSASNETTTSSVFDDYEEGTFTTGMVSSNLTLDDSSASSGHYVKIGRIVHACGVLSLNTNDGSPSVSGSDNITQSLPFQPRSTTAAMTGTIFQQNINAGPGTSVGHPHYYNPFPVDYLCYPASDGVRFYINKIEYAYERMTNSHMSAGFPGYTWMSWSITYQTAQ